MTIIRHNNPFPDIWAAFTRWNAEHKRIASLSDEERRAHKDAMKTAGAARQQIRRQQAWPEGGPLKQLISDVRALLHQISSNFWGIIRHGTFIRIALLGVFIDVIAGPVGSAFYCVGVLLHLFLYSEIACDDSMETALRRNTRLVGGIMLLLPIILLAILAPVTRDGIITMIPLLAGWLAPISYRGKWNKATRTTTEKNPWISGGMTILDIGLFALLMSIAMIRTESAENISLKDINWRLCNPYAWEQNSFTPSGLQRALAINDDIGTCLAGSNLLWQATPLHFAVHFGDNLDHVSTLIDHGADINARRDDGSTPLHDAVDRPFAQQSYITLLLALGANPTIRNDDGQTAADVAMGNQAISDSIVTQLYEAEEAWRNQADTPERNAHGG